MDSFNPNEANASSVATKVVSDRGEFKELSQNIVNNNNNVREMDIFKDMDYLGYNVIQLSQVMIELNGWSTIGGDAVKTAQRLAEQLRVPLAFDADKMYAVIDAIVAIENKELLADICKDAVKTSKIKFGHKQLDAAVQQLVREDKKSEAINIYDTNPNLIEIPKNLPKVVKDIIKCYPPAYHHVVLAVSMACLSFHAEGVEAIYSETEVYRLLWDVVAFADAAGGKSLLDRIKDVILKDVIERDTHYYAEEERAKNSTASGKKKRGRKKKSEVDDVDAEEANTTHQPKPIQYVGSTTSITELFFRALNSQGHNLFTYNAEGAEFFQSCKRGPNTDIWTFKRKGVEGSEYVQSHHSYDTVSGICHPFLTSVMCVQPEVGLPEFYKHIADGSASRIYPCSIDQVPGAKRPQIKAFSEKLIEEIGDTITYLQSLKEKIELKHLQRVIDKWLDDKALEYEKTDNLAIDHFRRRAAQMGYKAGVFFYILCGRKEGKQVFEYALYVAEFVLRQQIFYFGTEYNRQKKAGIEHNGINNINYYEMLGEVFTSGEFATLRAKHNEPTNVRTIICRWRNHKPNPLIEDVEPGVYRKLI